MKGFRDFLLRGNLIELAVAFIMASAFTAVVTAFTSIITDLIGLLFDVPDFSTTSVGGVSVGGFINAVIAFVVIAAVLYWGLVKPYQKFQQRQKSRQPGDVEETPYSTTESLLVEIRDLLRGR
ncbi:large conductance mechanosensitive channel protein MscL [Desertihabitans brevis]|uniref:large conductance mechanosensitive channel protein MscL n=1 Tax=Desertihabitans brevis TaxID=2268447 RepID=UPI001F3ADBE4|nr:large conductance mechanosensitive channel protein MscL [Desertihabitans brevis]